MSKWKVQAFHLYTAHPQYFALHKDMEHEQTKPYSPQKCTIIWLIMMRSGFLNFVITFAIQFSKGIKESSFFCLIFHFT